MRIKIQPEQTGSSLPYPYFISENGDVGRQDFWRGKPLKLIGFDKTPNAHVGVLGLEDFFKEPEKAIGLYPIFLHADGEWYTEVTKVGSIRKLENLH